jgi:hypothetical protein
MGGTPLHCTVHFYELQDKQVWDLYRYSKVKKISVSLPHKLYLAPVPGNIVLWL